MKLRTMLGMPGSVTQLPIAVPPPVPSPGGSLPTDHAAWPAPKPESARQFLRVPPGGRLFPADGRLGVVLAALPDPHFLRDTRCQKGLRFRNLTLVRASAGRV